MSSSEEEEDEHMAALRSIAKSTDAVIETQKSDAKKSPSKKKRKERGGGDVEGDAPLDGLQLKLRKILDGRLERTFGGLVFASGCAGDDDGDDDDDTKKAHKKERKKKKAKAKSGSDVHLKGGYSAGSEAFEGDVRFFRRVAKGAPSVLETQSSIREKAADVKSKTSKASSRKSKRRKVKGERSEAEEKELRKKSLAVLAVDTSRILKNAAMAKEKAKQNVVEVEELSGD